MLTIELLCDSKVVLSCGWWIVPVPLNESLTWQTFEFEPSDFSFTVLLFACIGWNAQFTLVSPFSLLCAFSNFLNALIWCLLVELQLLCLLQIIWLVLRFFLLATELSVIVFGFMFGESLQHPLCQNSVMKIREGNVIVTAAVLICISQLIGWPK